MTPKEAFKVITDDMNRKIARDLAGEQAIQMSLGWIIRILLVLVYNRLQPGPIQDYDHRLDFVRDVLDGKDYR